MNFRPIAFISRLRHPILTPLSAVSLLLLFLTLLVWLAAAIHPSCCYTIRWTERGNDINATIDGFGWNASGYHWRRADHHYHFPIDQVVHGYEDSPIIVKLLEADRIKFQSVRDRLTALAPRDSHRTAWRSPDLNLETLLPNVFLSGSTASSNGDDRSFVGWVKTFSCLPVLWLVVAAVGNYRRKHARSPGACPTCGYDLRASPTRCPECGTPVRRRRNLAPDRA